MKKKNPIIQGLLSFNFGDQLSHKEDLAKLGYRPYKWQWIKHLKNIYALYVFDEFKLFFLNLSIRAIPFHTKC